MDGSVLVDAITMDSYESMELQPDHRTVLDIDFDRISKSPIGNSTWRPVLPIQPTKIDEMCELYLFCVVGIIGGAVCIVGVIGNILSLVVISKIGRDSITFHLLAVLGVVEIIHLTCYFMAQTVPEILLYVGRDTMPESAYIAYTWWILGPVLAMALSASIWITTLVTTYRFITAKKLFKHSKVCSMMSVNCQIAAIIVLSVLLDIPKYFERMPQTNTHAGFVKLETTDLWHNHLYQLVYKNIIMLTIRRIIPITITIIMVYKRARLLENWRLYRARSFNKHKLPDDQERISRVLLLLAIIFIVCQIPGAVYPIFRIIMDIPAYQCDHFYLYFYTVADLLVAVYSALTFFIFYPSIPQYRRVLRVIFCPESERNRRCSVETQRSVVSVRDDRARTLSTIA